MDATIKAMLNGMAKSINISDHGVFTTTLELSMNKPRASALFHHRGRTTAGGVPLVLLLITKDKSHSAHFVLIKLLYHTFFSAVV